MDIKIALACSTLTLVAVLIEQRFIGTVLLLTYCYFVFVCLHRKYTIGNIGALSWQSVKSALVVLKVLILIGGIIGIWMASGTIPAAVYYALDFVQADYYVLLCFILCAGLSFLIGTSFGTCSILGVPLMLIANAGHGNTAIIAGAIISGAYFGDRMSFMSSSAVLVANVSESTLPSNIKNMARSGIVATMLTVVFFFIISQNSTLSSVDSGLQIQLSSAFDISPILLLPALLLLVMAVGGIRMDVAMLTSIGVAFLLTLFKQNQSLLEAVHAFVLGYQMNDEANPLTTIIRGGGVLSMGKAAFVVFASSALMGILAELKVLSSIKNRMEDKSYSRTGLFLMTLLVSTIVGMVGCNQTIAIIMTADIMKKPYEKFNWQKYKNDKTTMNQQLAIDIENSGVLIAGLIPWSIASMVPASTLGVTPFDFMPVAFFLYAIPICYFIQLLISEKIKGKTITDNL